MKPCLTLITAATLFSSPATLLADDFAAQREQVLALGKLTTPPSTHDAEGMAREGGMKPIFFEALPWKGKPTRVFAWLGMPATQKGKVPAMVLVHGGGGTAHKEWVKKWNDHGFAAISIAVEGQTDDARFRWLTGHALETTRLGGSGSQRHLRRLRRTSGRPVDVSCGGGLHPGKLAPALSARSGRGQGGPHGLLLGRSHHQHGHRHRFSLRLRDPGLRLRASV